MSRVTQAKQTNKQTNQFIVQVSAVAVWRVWIPFDQQPIETIFLASSTFAFTHPTLDVLFLSQLEIPCENLLLILIRISSTILKPSSNLISCFPVPLHCDGIVAFDHRLA
jgi:hypothetical protein